MGRRRLHMLAALMCFAICGVTSSTSSTADTLAGGDGTVFDTSRNAFSLPARNLREEHRSSFFVGNSFFNQNWVVAPASVAGRDGLGPLFNARKAEQPSVLQQTAAAFVGDIGITSSLFHAENHTPGQHVAAAPRVNGEPEVSERILRAVALYARSLAVPAARTSDDPRAVRGRQLFMAARCGACHAAELETGAYSDLPELANQTIHPFTDLLLHDMGDGLADDRPTFAATGREWRTAPLWGLGLVAKVNGHTFLLHDGRARNFSEAILWHGGEAAASRQRFRAMSTQDRAALIAFLESL